MTKNFSKLFEQASGTLDVEERRKIFCELEEIQMTRGSIGIAYWMTLQETQKCGSTSESGASIQRSLDRRLMKSLRPYIAFKALMLSINCSRRTFRSDNTLFFRTEIPA